MLVLGFLIPDWRSNNRYIASSSVVVDKRVHSQLFDVAGPKGQGVRQVEHYRPEIKIQYEVNGRKFESWSYDATGNHSPDRAAQQAIANSFQVGATYPCWYDPDRPERAILVRGHTWSSAGTPPITPRASGRSTRCSSFPISIFGLDPMSSILSCQTASVSTSWSMPVAVANKLREDVTLLSRFLGKPVWDAL